MGGNKLNARKVVVLPDDLGVGIYRLIGLTRQLKIEFENHPGVDLVIQKETHPGLTNILSEDSIFIRFG